MSSIYIQEPPTAGKIVLRTTLGELEIELWPKQAPIACKNFVQLCVDGYYDGCIFHRVIPKFMAQTGDPSGQGNGGVAAYGDPFEVEVHSRLRFTHRGLLAMAADEDEHKNKSQFFITLDKTPELEGQHTIFGKIVGDTIFNILKCSDLEIGDNDRPAFPPRIISTSVISNPFEDVIFRPGFVKEKVSVGETEKEKRVREARDRKGVRNQALLSFDDDFEGEIVVPLKSKSKAMHDLVNNSRLVKAPVPLESSRTVKKAATEETKQIPTKENVDLPDKKHGTEVQISKKEPVEPVDDKDEMLDEIAKLKKEIKTLNDITSGASHSKTITKEKRKRTLLEEERDGFLEKSLKSKRVIVGKDRKKTLKEMESGTLARLNGFASKLKSIAPEETNETKDEVLCSLHNVPNCESCKLDEEQHVDGDQGDWMAHSLKFDKDLKGKNLLDPNARRDDINDLIVIDPRDRESTFLKKNKSKTN